MSNSNYWKAFAPGVLGLVAAICGTAANFYCETIAFPEENGNNNDDDDDMMVVLAGIFNYRTKNYDGLDNSWASTTCRYYSKLEKDNASFSYDIDSKTRTTMAFAYMTIIIGGLSMVYGLLLPCCRISESQWKMIGGLFLLSSLFQGLTLLILQSSLCSDNPLFQLWDHTNDSIQDDFRHNDCEIAAGYRLNITAVVFWALAGISTFILPVPVVVHAQPTQSQTVTYQQNADGTVEETGVTVVKGAPVEQAQVQVEDTPEK